MYSLLIIIYLAFISLGLPDSLLGSAWPVIYQEINVPISYMGIISMIISAGTIISSLMSNKLTQRFGTSAVTTFSVFMTATALLGFSFSKSIFFLIVFSIPYGFGAGAIDSALNNYVALHYSSKHMSWLHCFWGVGTIISPFIMSYSLANTNWSIGYRTVSIIQFIIAFILLFATSIWRVNERKNVSAMETSKSLGIKQALKIRGVPSLLFAFFCYCAAESTAMAWSCTYLVESKGINEELAAALASLFFIGMTVGRFFSGFITNKLGDKKMIFLGTAILMLGIFLMLIPVNTYIASLVGLVLLGLGCAPIYPSIIHSTPENFGAENSGAIIGIQMASAYAGTTFVSPLFGVIAKITGFVLFPVYMLVIFVVMAIKLKRTFDITNKNERMKYEDN